MKEKSVKNPQSLLVEWNRVIGFKVKNSQELLDLFEENGIQKDILNRRAKILKNSQDLLQDFFEKGIEKLVRTFNPLDVLLKYYSPNEDNYTDLMAALLDPLKKHGLGKTGLYTLLNIVAQRDKRKERICSAICNELKTKEIIGVFPRQRLEKSVPDITITGQNFVIGIENKRSLGGEHETVYNWQTINQYNDLKQKRKNHILFIYNHPEGIPPKSKDCVRLDKHDILSWYEEIAKKTENKELGAFLNFYANYYFKTI